MRHTVTLPHEPRSVPLARRELERVAQVVDDVTYRNLRLLVSELVTNVVRHVPGGPGRGIELVLERRDGRVRIEVADCGPGFAPTPRREDQDPGSGWGIHLVALLSARWGVEREPRARVWFEFPSRET